MATPKEKIIFERLMNMGEKNKAWQLIQQVTGVKLQGKEFDLVAEGLQNNGISFRVQKGKNKFATTMTVNNEQVGVYQYDATTGRSIAEIYPEFKGKGFGKLLVLHAIYTAAKLGLDFQVDESRTAEYDNVLDSLSSNSYIVDDDGYWYVTGEGEQYLQQSLKQGVAEGSEQSLSSMRSQDQSERNEYEQLVKSQAGGDWSKGAKMYAQLKKRPSTDIFGDAVRQDKFMKMKFNFDKFTDKDWEDYWTLAQHCDKNRDFQKNALSVIKKYQGMGHDNYKFLYDRISKGLTGKQKYGTQNGYKASGVTEGLSIDVPNEEWLQDKIDYAKSKGRDEWGAPFFGSTTAYARPNPQVSVVRLELLKGMRNEQDNVRSKDLEWLMAHMEKTGKLPLNDRGEEYAPYVMVAYNGEAWVSEGNHRIMAAYRLGRKTLPVQLAYFDGGERVESGIMYPKKIGL